ncbi:MAG: endonuclease MutS2 [Oscillospiraceae bacterium]|nr:endonuclease MutS2 [Oscillospiraceae bacterium]
MVSLKEKSLKTLELDAVLRILSEHAVSDGAKKLALELSPSTDIDEVRTALARTGAARKLIGIKGSPSFSGVRDIAPLLRRAAIGGLLNPAELLSVADILRCARGAQSYLEDDRRNEKTELDSFFAALFVDKSFEDKVRNAIISPEEIADGASSELLSIRRKMRRSGEKIREVLAQIISSPTKSKYLQETIITQRSGRFVVPVKSEYKGEIKGLVHDISSTGATLFVEPIQVVELNNAMRELEAEEKKEIERILAELSVEASGISDGLERDYQILTRLDLIFAMGQFSYTLNGEAPTVNDKGVVNLINARHPLLDKMSTVPISIRLGKDFDTLVITGPNTGGKTVSLKTVGLLTLMAECGMYIPCDYGSEISVFKRIYADIGDEQSIEQSLSTFSSHMKNIVEIIAGADDESLVLVDELGAGTDPIEGAALAVSIIEYIMAIGAKIIATTHYAELKSFALITDRVENASCEFDVTTLKPTYRLLIGIPGKSNAFAISERLGLPMNIINSAGALVEREDKRFDEILSRLEEKQKALDSELEHASELRSDAENRKKKTEQFEKELEKRKVAVIEKAREDAEKILKDAREAAEKALDDIKEIRKLEAKKADRTRINEAQNELKRGLNEAERGVIRSKPRPTPKPLPRPLRAGDTVELCELGLSGTVVEISEKTGMLTVQAGIMKVSARPEEVSLIEESGEKTVREFIAKKKAELRNISVKPEVDIRGMTADEAEYTLSTYLDNAFLAKLNTVTIIHGKGTGVLRKTVHSYLRSHPHVKSWRLGVYGEGEDGVTITELRI